MKTLEGCSKARKGKIRAEDGLWQNHHEQGSLPSYFNQLAARALTCLRASLQARSWWLSSLDGSPCQWSYAGGVPVAFLFFGVSAITALLLLLQRRPQGPKYQVIKFKFDLQPGSLTVQVAGEHQP